MIYFTMKEELTVRKWIGIVVFFALASFHINAQNEMSSRKFLTEKQQSLISIAALTARGDLKALKPSLNKGLEAGLTVNQIKESIVHLYAYCGFPRSIRGLQTFMEVLDERKAEGINDTSGAEASPIEDKRSKYERGKEVLEKLTGVPQESSKTGYSVFAPEIEIFLKEHLFADIFERDVLTYAERELVTISVISSIGKAEPMLRSHMNICLNVGITPEQLQQFVTVLKTTLGKKGAKAAQKVLDEVLSATIMVGCNNESKTGNNPAVEVENDIFPKGDLIANNNFTGKAWLNMLITDKEKFDLTVGKVLFESGARTNWHSHPGGQILLCTKGKGYYQEKGKPIQLLNVGDVVEIFPDVVHWHGAAHDTEFEHIAISSQQSKGSVVWLEPVTDEEYNYNVTAR